MRHTDWCRIRVSPDSDPETARALIPTGRLLLGQMMNGLKLVDQPTGVLRRELPDGSKITVSFDGTTPVIDIDTTATEETPPEGALYNLWVPRGFVVYPAWHDAPFGVGLPIIPDADEDVGPYDASNLAPGLTKARWTPSGPCGEVLLSADENAGYPRERDTPVPLLYHPTKGPVFRWTGNTVFDARPIDGAWKAYRLELAPFTVIEPGQNPGEQRTLLELANAARIAAGATPATQRLRGFSRPAEIMASIMDAAGSDAATSSGYPPTYQTPADRLTKDGYSSDWLFNAFTSFNREDAYAAQELRATNGAAGAVAAWQNDPVTNAVLTLDYGTGLFADAGAKNGHRALTLTSRDRWIAAGNMSWQSSDANLPPLSWHGFASINLAWETYPATFDVFNTGTKPLVPLYAFTNAQGDCWLNYPRSTDPHSYAVEPAMGRHIYSRGRAIALAPNGALVWGACTQRVMVGTADNRHLVDRLILLAHHPEDQPADYTHEGWTRYLRVWWADVPPRTLGLDPQQVICGTDAADPLAWRGGDLIDVGHMTTKPDGTESPAGTVNSLKYASQWRFAPDGKRAVCLRDYGVYLGYASQHQVVGVQTQVGLVPRAVELAFDATTDSVTTTATFHPYASNPFASRRAIAAPLDTPASPNDGPMYEYPINPVAVDYAGGGLLYAYAGVIGNFIQSTNYLYAGTAVAAAVYPSDLGQRFWRGTGARTATSNMAPTALTVADVRSGAFLSEGVRPQYTDDGTPTGADCILFTDTPSHGVRMSRSGRVLDERWYPCPDGAVFSLVDVCTNAGGSTPDFVELPLAQSRFVQASFAERFGQSIFSYQLAPVPLAVRALDAPPSDATCGCRLEIHAYDTAAHWLTFAELAPRGGHAVASVPLPDADWLIFAKVA